MPVLVQPAFMVVSAKPARWLPTHQSVPLAGRVYNTGLQDEDLAQLVQYRRAFPGILETRPEFIEDVSHHGRLDGARSVVVLARPGSDPDALYARSRVAVRNSVDTLRRDFEMAGFGDVTVTKPAKWTLGSALQDLGFRAV